MRLTTDQIRDYETCPRYYDFKYGSDAVPVKLSKRQQNSQDFLKTIERVAKFYLYKKQSFSDPTLKSLYNRWEKDWYKETTAGEIMKLQNSVQQNSKTAFGTRAMEVIRRIYEDFESVSGDQVFWLNEGYAVPILNQDIVLEGNVDLVIRHKEANRFNIFKWSDSSQPSHYYKYDLAGAEYAVRYRYDFREMETRHYLWNLYGNRIGRKEVTLERKDFAIMGYYASEIERDNIYASRFGFSTQCKECPYTNKCLRWQMPQRKDDLNVKQ